MFKTLKKDMFPFIVKHQTIEAVSSLSFPQFLTGANNYEVKLREAFGSNRANGLVLDYYSSISKPYCIYGFDILEQRETCLFYWFESLRKIAVKGGAGGLKARCQAI